MNINVENTIKENLKSLPTTTQLRLLLSNAVVIKNKMDMEKNNNSELKEDISDTLKNEIKYLLIKHIYQCGRDSKVFTFNETFKISDEIKKIKTKKDFYAFFRYLEEIIAYTKYFEKNEIK